jgi:hypothetical protein
MGSLCTLAFARRARPSRALWPKRQKPFQRRQNAEFSGGFHQRALRAWSRKSAARAATLISPSSRPAAAL